METKPIQRRDGRLPVVLEESEELCLSPLLCYLEGSEKGPYEDG